MCVVYITPQIKADFEKNLARGNSCNYEGWEGFNDADPSNMSQRR